MIKRKLVNERRFKTLVAGVTINPWQKTSRYIKRI